MNDDLLQRVRNRLLAIREKGKDPILRAELAAAVGELDQFERLSPPAALDEWRRVHAKNWIGTSKQQTLLRLFLNQGEVHKDHIAAVLSDDRDNPVSDEAVRAAITRLRVSLEQAKATATVKPAGRDSIYRTHDPRIQTLR
jgi:hypothetical protein